ncbi:hypothetical protein LCGC14_1760040 [marine sediment metagenome]|uniref:Uncharacterized protein n=1 Tax=marine sediment metagenome TaxID=412755 RepID=A0A0F9H1F5_9ZZZZ
MLKNNINRTRRRKQERDAVMSEYRSIAAGLGLQLISVHGLRLEVFQDAVDLLLEASDILPPDANALVKSASPENGVFIVVRNALPMSAIDM